MSTLVNTFAERRRADIAREKAIRYLTDQGLPPHMLAFAEETLAELPSAHKVWIGTSELLRQWRRRRMRLQCAVAGLCLCLWCEQEFGRGQQHWCIPGGAG